MVDTDSRSREFCTVSYIITIRNVLCWVIFIRWFIFINFSFLFIAWAMDLIDLVLEVMSVRLSVRPQKVFLISLEFGVWVVLDRLCLPVWPQPDLRSRWRSWSFWSCENCTFLGLSPPLFWRVAQNWWLIVIVWHLVYSLSEPDFGISF